MASGDVGVLTFRGSIERAEIPRLCRHLRELIENTGCRFVVCDVGAIAEPDAVTLDALARLQLTARRADNELRLRHPPGELQELLELAGLAEIVPLAAEFVVVEGEPEQGEEPRGVEEEAEARDPAPRHLDDLQ